MSKREDYEQWTGELLVPIVDEYGLSVYDVEYVKEGKDFYLRAYIDKEGGVTIEDCERVSRALSDALDERDFIPEAYILEVSSPGLGRALKKDIHLTHSIGKSIDIKFYKPTAVVSEASPVKEISGVLRGFDRETLTLGMGEGDYPVSRKDVAAVNLTLEL